MYRYLFIAVVLICWAWGASAIFSMNTPRVELADGKLRGKYVLTKGNKRVRAFMGIPYAKPPVRELRFKSPELPEPWEKERWALDLPKPCVQPDQRHGEPIGEEDCLYLNVFTPESVEKRIMAHTKLTDKKNETTAENATTIENATVINSTMQNFASENETMDNEIPDNTINGTVVIIKKVNGTAVAMNSTYQFSTQANLTLANGGGTQVTFTVSNGDGTETNLTAPNGDGTQDNLTATNGNGALDNSTSINGNGTLVNMTESIANVTQANETIPEPPPRLCLPVMVFFHGGGFETGRSEAFTHEYLLDADVLLVTVQYRLGLLGFLSTGDSALPGNLGLKDQRLALQWVKENIEKFGGCPEKVTIFGDDAGGASVHYHMLFGKSKNDTFRAGISMSGTALSPWAFRPPTEVAHMVDRIARITRCPVESEDFVSCLWNMRAEDFVFILQKYKNETLGGCGEWMLSFPALGGVLEDCRVEDAFITANPWDKKISLPWMVGVTNKEMLYEFTEQLVDRRNKKFPALEKCFNESLPKALGYPFSNASADNLAEQVRKFYFKEEPISRDLFADVVEAVSDGSIVYPTFEAVRRAGRRSTWLYHFNYIGSNTYGPSALDGRIAPGGGDDLFFLFPRPLGKNVPRKNKEPDTVMSKKMVNLWTNFATYLDPTPSLTKDGVKWPPIAPSTTFLNIGQSVMVVERPFFSFRMNFWSMEDFPHRDDHYGDGLCLKTAEPIDEEATNELPLVLPSDFYPSLKWTLKGTWQPSVDPVKDSTVNAKEDKEEITTTTTKPPKAEPEVYDDTFFPALRWTLKAGWRPLVDSVAELDVVKIVNQVEDDAMFDLSEENKYDENEPILEGIFDG